MTALANKTTQPKKKPEHSIALRERTKFHSIHQYRECSATIQKADAWMVLSISRTAFVCECVSGVSIILHLLLLHGRAPQSTVYCQPIRLPSKSIQSMKIHAKKNSCAFINGLRLDAFAAALSLRLEESIYSSDRLVCRCRWFSFFQRCRHMRLRVFVSARLCVSFPFFTFRTCVSLASHLQAGEGTKMQLTCYCKCQCVDKQHMHVSQFKSAYMLPS